MSTPVTIYHGLWQNEATNKWVLTLSARGSGFLAAALVTWVGAMSIPVWNVAKWILYTVRDGKEGPKSVFHHQRQALLRNSGSPGGYAWNLLFVAWAWRRQRISVFLHTMPDILFSLVIFVAFTVAGIFVPYVYTKIGSDVLLQPTSLCGTVIITNGASTAQAAALANRYSLEQTTAASSYVDECYGGASNSTTCQQYPQSSLNFTMTDADCPFVSPDLCISVNSTPVALDTGYLNSNIDLGINAKQADSVNYRKLTTCSPVHSVPFVTVTNTSLLANASNYIPGTVLENLNYGPLFDTPYTYQYNLYSQLFPMTYNIE